MPPLSTSRVWRHQGRGRTRSPATAASSSLWRGSWEADLGRKPSTPSRALPQRQDCTRSAPT
eukprot:674018-Lingulodinium_polyedra.AAC.1